MERRVGRDVLAVDSSAEWTDLQLHGFIPTDSTISFIQCKINWIEFDGYETVPAATYHCLWNATGVCNATGTKITVGMQCKFLIILFQLLQDCFRSLPCRSHLQ